MMRLRFAGNGDAVLLNDFTEELGSVFRRIINGQRFFHSFVAKRNRSPKQYLFRAGIVV